jgi:hypothetical protein
VTRQRHRTNGTRPASSGIRKPAIIPASSRNVTSKAATCLPVHTLIYMPLVSRAAHRPMGSSDRCGRCASAAPGRLFQFCLSAPYLLRNDKNLSLDLD